MHIVTNMIHHVGDNVHYAISLNIFMFFVSFVVYSISISNIHLLHRHSCHFPLLILAYHQQSFL